MAGLGYVVPQGQDSKESFHALRRTTEGLLYYTKVNKNGSDSVDFEGGSPTDLNGNSQISSKIEYVDADPFVQAGETQYETGDGSTLTFSMSSPVLDDTRVCVYLDGVKQILGEQFTYSSPTVTFIAKPKSGAQIAICKVDRKYKNNTNDFYHQFRHEAGDATYYVDSDGYFVKRENVGRDATALASDDFSTFEATSTVASTSWQSNV
tara:strand:+ start:1152 stop:1775 length:624 start_codon:yes stop_codon:yes gene_type:complete